ncbi:PREDICTED: dual specificity protein phosphatase 8-like [Vollenhovia emeryi]|uniref:dual specificity protein phosphatase 8-like n=1 Tax=Vollenhovia emeryi TaxID=411798 RepID=UPI0005F55093|nr:PREDICTED: dual specificity protein phosphatase 8-like [Vollenhovia emeryi]
MSSTLEKKIMNLEERLRAENESRDRDRQVGGGGGGEAGGPGGVGLHSSSSSSSSSATAGPASSPALRRPRQRKQPATGGTRASPPGDPPLPGSIRSPSCPGDAWSRSRARTGYVDRVAAVDRSHRG